MEKPAPIYARQRIIYTLPHVHTEDLILPPHPAGWWRPKGGAITGVELLGVDKPSEEIIRTAEMYGWRYCEVDGRFYPL
jgi:hypothetical protein